MPLMTAGQAVVEALRAERIPYVFGLVGSTFLDILDALHEQPDIKFLGVRHEQGAAFMADGFARISGLPGVCLVTPGPGATNLLTGVYAAYVGHSPVIAITGGSSTEVIDRDSFQEVNHLSLFSSVTKQSIRINRTERIPELFRHAFRLAMSGKKGPVFIDIPRDLLNNQMINADFPAPESYRVHQRQIGDLDLLSQAASLLSTAKNPLIIAGGGINSSEASQQVVDLAELLSAPMVTSYGRNDAVPNNHSLYVGPLGRAGAPEAGEICSKADIIVAAGTRLSNFTSFYDNRYISKEAQIIQIDIDDKEIGRNYPVSIGLQGDAKAILQGIIDILRLYNLESTNPDWKMEAQILRKRRIQRLNSENSLETLPLKPQRVYSELRKVLPANTIVALDAGACPAYGYDRLEFNHPRSFITPLDLGGLGFAFPEALGAKLARPDIPVIAIHGDGGFLFNVQELETAVREHINTVTIVMNNNEWGSEKAYQRAMYGDRLVGSDLTNPRFDKLAELFGAKGFFIERPDDICSAVEEALASDLPSVIEVPVDPDELPTPVRLA